MLDLKASSLASAHALDARGSKVKEAVVLDGLDTQLCLHPRHKGPSVFGALALNVGLPAGCRVSCKKRWSLELDRIKQESDPQLSSCYHLILPEPICVADRRTANGKDLSAPPRSLHHDGSQFLHFLLCPTHLQIGLRR